MKTAVLLLITTRAEHTLRTLETLKTLRTNICLFFFYLHETQFEWCLTTKNLDNYFHPFFVIVHFLYHAGKNR